MSESRSFVKSGILFLSIALVVNGMFSLALFSTVQTGTHHSISFPDYDSGWRSIDNGTSLILMHNLGTADVSIEMWGNDSYGCIHQRNYGGSSPTPLGFINPPAYDSGWTSINPGQEIVLTHNLDTTEVFVYMVGQGSGQLHQYAHGSYRWYGEEAQRDRGVYWTLLTDTTITVHRCANDDLIRWNQVRVMIWRIQEPPWQYANMNGAHWDNLTRSTIEVYREPSDQDWNQVRVRMWKMQSSGVGGLWIPVDKISLLAPYIALVSTIILAISVSVAYIKIRKKQ